jgi:thioredoxin 1
MLHSNKGRGYKTSTFYFVFPSKNDMFKNVMKSFLKDLGMIEVSNERDLESHLQNNKRVLALFYTSWCPYCRIFLSIFDRNASKRGFNLVLRVRVDNYNNPIWDKYSIDAVPTVLLFYMGKVCRRLNGRFGSGLSERELKEWLKEEN